MCILELIWKYLIQFLIWRFMCSLHGSPNYANYWTHTGQNWFRFDLSVSFNYWFHICGILGDWACKLTHLELDSIWFKCIWVEVAFEWVSLQTPYVKLWFWFLIFTLVLGFGFDFHPLVLILVCKIIRLDLVWINIWFWYTWTMRHSILAQNNPVIPDHGPYCRAHLHEECPQHHAPTGDSEWHPGLVTAVVDGAQVMLV